MINFQINELERAAAQGSHVVFIEMMAWILAGIQIGETGRILRRIENAPNIELITLRN